MSKTEHTTEAASAPQAGPAVVAPLEGGVRRGGGWLRECWTAALHGKWSVSWGDWPGRGPKRWRLVTTYAQGWCMVYLHLGPLVIGVDY